MTTPKLLETDVHPCHRPLCRVILGVATIIASFFFASWSHASDLNSPRSTDEFWLVSARDIADCDTDADCTQLKCLRKTNGQWCEAKFSDLSSAHNSDQSKQTVLHVHGMRTNFDDARRQCSTVYQNIFAECDARPPIRFVCWVWRSETETRRPVHEFKTKSRRSVLLGRLFTKTLRCFGERPPVLVGYSLGAQLIVSAITAPDAANLPCYRFAALAPVLDCNFSQSQAIRIPARTQQTVLFSSSIDRATRFAGLICKKQHASPFVQWATGPAMPLGYVDSVDVTAYVGRKHSVDRYSSAAPVKMCIGKMVRDNFLQFANQMVGSLETPLIISDEPAFNTTSPQFNAQPTWGEPELLEPTLVAPAE